MQILTSSIDGCAQELVSRLATAPIMLVSAPPGSGKTTRLPLAILDTIGFSPGSVIMLEPRRLAALAAASYMARLRNENVGGTIGYAVRFKSAVSKKTALLVMTEGVLLRRIQQDPMLDGVRVVVFDEFHERSLESDVCLALCREIQSFLRPDLRIVVMSATLDNCGLDSFCPDAPRIVCQTRPYPITVTYRPVVQRHQPLSAAMASVIQEALRETTGDILVFLPGMGEIRAVERLLAPPQGVVLYRLHGSLALEQQQMVMAPSGARKVILSSAIAESSLTIDSVRVVIDSGFARTSRLDAGTGLERLVTVRLSRASAIQRAGRAGRTAPGICYRLYSEHTFQGLTPQNSPEILRGDLSRLVLELAAWGGDTAVSKLVWIDTPPDYHLKAARSLLIKLGAITEQGICTDIGKRMLAIPLHPRLSRVLLAAESLQMVPLASEVLAGIGLTQGSDRTTIARQLCRCMGVTWCGSLYDVTASDLPVHCLLMGWPDRVAKRRRDGSENCYLLMQGSEARMRSHEGTPASEYILALDVQGVARGSAIISMAVALDESEIRASLGDTIITTTNVSWDSRYERITAIQEERLGALVLSDRTVRVPQEACVRLWRERIAASEGKCLPWSNRALQLQARVRVLKNHQQLSATLPAIDTAFLLEDCWPMLASVLASCTSTEKAAAIDLYGILRQQIGYASMIVLDREVPEQIVVPSGRMLSINYHGADQPFIAVKLQELFGCRRLPRLAQGLVAIQIQMLSPAGRVIGITSDLAVFWHEGYPLVRKDLRGRYPKHPWPEDPLTAVATSKTTKALSRKE